MLVDKFAKLYLAPSKIKGAGRGGFAGEYNYRAPFVLDEPWVKETKHE